MNKGKIAIEIIITWLFPGAGFIIKKNYIRGLFFFFILNITFLIGLFLKGAVIWPVWNPDAEGFNIVNILTFIVQLGNGFVTLISMVASEIFLKTSELNRENLSAVIKFLAGKESYPFFDIASFFLIVSGGMNYFVVTNFYDQYYKIEEKD